MSLLLNVALSSSTLIIKFLWQFSLHGIPTFVKLLIDVYEIFVSLISVEINMHLLQFSVAF